MNATEGETKYCPECGEEIREAAEICPDCGASQSGPEPSAEDTAVSSASLGLVFAAVGLISGLFSMLFAPLVFAVVTILCGIVAVIVYERKVIGALVVLWGVAAPVLAFLIRDYVSGVLG